MSLWSGGIFRRRSAKPDVPPRGPDQGRLLTYRVANLQGRGSRRRQEDSFAFANAMDVTEIRRKGLLAVVCDGMGGMEDGKRVSETAVAELLTGFAGMDRGQDLAYQLKECVLRAGERVYSVFQGVGGTTLVACIFFREALYWASVGDSCLYLKRRGGLYRLNQEQNLWTELCLEAVRAGRLETAGADEDPDRHRLSQFLGKSDMDEVDMSLLPLALEDGDTVLLCSDGVGGVLDESEMLICLEAPTPGDACTRLDERVRAAGRTHQDNYTALVVMCGY